MKDLEYWDSKNWALSSCQWELYVYVYECTYAIAIKRFLPEVKIWIEQLVLGKLS